MSYAQVHYPFENAEWFEHHFPADFIVEYIGQTRGWFYMLHILVDRAVRPAGVQLGDLPRHRAGLRRPEDVASRCATTPTCARSSTATAPTRCAGSSWAVPILRGGNLIVTEQGIRDGVRQVIIPLWNTWYFFSLYANAFGSGRVRTSGVCRQVVDRVHRPARPLPAGQAAPVRRDDDGPARRLRGRQRLRDDSWLPRRAHQLVRPPVARAVLGHRFRRRLGRVGRRHASRRSTRSTPRSRSSAAGHRAAAAARHRGDLARAHGRPVGAPHRLAATARPAGRRRAGRRAWTAPARSAPWPRRCARPRGCGSGCRCATSPSSRPDAAALKDFAAIIADEVNVRTVRCATSPTPARPTSASPSG